MPKWYNYWSDLGLCYEPANTPFQSLDGIIHIDGTFRKDMNPFSLIKTFKCYFHSFLMNTIPSNNRNCLCSTEKSTTKWC
mmetsp:Transcript_40297/g.63233  ORF Transcript_40297/g.63233 Transcript_40297/m.63233 type:complete len:80 (-) Transcript_40297:135-374(-)